MNAVWGFTGCRCLISQTRPKGFSLLVLPSHIFLTTPPSFSVTQQKTSRYEQRNQRVTTHQYRKHQRRSGNAGGCCATSFRHRAQILKVTWAYKVASTLRNSPFLEAPGSSSSVAQYLFPAPPSKFLLEMQEGSRLSSFPTRTESFLTREHCSGTVCS